MSVSVIGATSTTSLVSAWCNVSATGVPIKYSIVMPIGLYRVRQYASGNASTPTATVYLLDASGNTLATGALVDWDTSSTGNYAEQYFSITSAGAGVSINTNTLGWLSVEQVGSAITGTSGGTVTSYQSSQTVTIAANALCALIGGGGAGGGGGTTSQSGGGGGGSGYLQKFAITPGSYPLVCGAGGSGTSAGAGTAGGNSTFNGYTANGGSGGSGGWGGGGQGGAGGSGGAGASYGNGGAVGGANGANGNSSSATGGTGSGVTFPYWTTPGTGGAGNGGGSVGSGGGVYAGGGSGGNFAVNGNGGAATAIGGGGGGGSTNGAASTGGAGGTGGLIVGVGF